MSDVHWLTATQIVAAYAERALSPVELVHSLLDRIQAFDTGLNAFISVDAERALANAHLAEIEISSGHMRGPLHGVPVCIKDIIDIAGQPTTCHSKIMVDHLAREDAVVVARLRAAGAIIIGKTALHEFAIGGPAHDLPFPPARNPWNVRHHAGGSSSGTASALAAGFVPLGVGTDTGGSIRNPAGHCGVTGIKPTYGVVPRHGVFPLCFTLDHVGPMARSVPDLALLMDSLAGHSAADPASVPGPVRSFGADIVRGVRGLRIGLVRHFHEFDMVASEEVVASIDEVARVLAEQGALVRDVQLPRLQDFSEVHRVIFHSEAWAIHSKWLRERPEDYSGISRRKLLPGAFLYAEDYVRAQQRRSQLIDAVNDVFRDVDVLLVANSMDPACDVSDDGECIRTYARHARAPFNLTGHPALAVMSGLSKDGLPLSVQLVGRPFDESVVLRAGAAYERATKWNEFHPPLNLEKHRATR